MVGSGQVESGANQKLHALYMRYQSWGGLGRAPTVAVACSETGGGSATRATKKKEWSGYILLALRCDGAIGHDLGLVVQRAMGVPVQG